MKQKAHLITKLSHAPNAHMKQYITKEFKAKEITGVMKLKTKLLNLFIALFPTAVYHLRHVHHTIHALRRDTEYYVVNAYGTIQ